MTKEKSAAWPKRIAGRTFSVLWCLLLVAVAVGLFGGKLAVGFSPVAGVDYGVGLALVLLAVLALRESRIAFHCSFVLTLICLCVGGIWGIVLQRDIRLLPGALVGVLGVVYLIVKSYEYRNVTRKNICLWTGLSVIAFSSLFIYSHRLEARVRVLEGLVRRAELGRPTPNDYSCFMEQIGDASVVFLGESPHHTIDLRQAVMNISVYLARHANVRVLACESLYGLYPFLEAESMGIQEPNGPSEYVDPIVLTHNESVSDDEKILVTSLDIEHSINHSKHRTIRFLEYLANASTVSTARAGLLEFIPRLSSCQERDALHAYLDELEGLFNSHEETFAPQAWEEVTFALEMMRASVDFQMQRKKLRNYQFRPKQTAAIQEIRAKYFRKTIERALSKAEKRGGRLICYVGGAHAVKTATSWSTGLPGPKSEAYHFGQLEPSTKGQVASILLHALSFNGQDHKQTRDLEDVAHRVMGEQKTVYIPLGSLVTQGVDLSWSRYFTKGGPKYDGILFFRDVKKASR